MLVFHVEATNRESQAAPDRLAASDVEQYIRSIAEYLAIQPIGSRIDLTFTLLETKEAS